MKSISRFSIRMLSFSLLLILFFVACTKNSTPPQVSAPVDKPPVTAVYVSNSQYLTVDSFSSDSYGHLFRFQCRDFDTSTSPYPQLLDSFDLQFSYSNGKDLVPSSYKMHALNSGPNTFDGETHLLYYDGQNRIVKDSMLNAPYSGSVTNNAVVTTYQYSNNLIVVNNIQNSPTGLRTAFVDSFFTNTAGNLIHKTNRFYLNTNPVLEVAFTSSNYANPFYNKNWSASLGPLLSFVFEMDYISPSMYSSVQWIEQVNHPIVNFTWITDAKGRIVKNQSPGSFGLTVHYSN